MYEEINRKHLSAVDRLFGAGTQAAVEGTRRDPRLYNFGTPPASPQHLDLKAVSEQLARQRRELQALMKAITSTGDVKSASIQDVEQLAPQKKAKQRQHSDPLKAFFGDLIK